MYTMGPWILLPLLLLHHHGRYDEQLFGHCAGAIDALGDAQEWRQKLLAGWEVENAVS